MRSPLNWGMVCEKRKASGSPGVLLPGYPPGPVYQVAGSLGIDASWPLWAKFHKLVRVPRRTIGESDRWMRLPEFANQLYVARFL